MSERINAADAPVPPRSFILKIADGAKTDGAILGPTRILPRSASAYETDIYINGLHLVVLACLEGQHQHTNRCKAIPCPAGMCLCVRLAGSVALVGIEAGPVIQSSGSCGVEAILPPDSREASLLDGAGA